MIWKAVYAILGVVISLYIGIAVPRQLGVDAYATYSYITATFAFILQCLLISSNTAYVYHLAQSEFQKQDLNKVYVAYLFLIAVLVPLFIFSDIAIFASDIFSLDAYGIEVISLGYLYSILLFFQQRSIDYADATDNFIWAEKIRLFTRCLLCVLLISVQLYSQLSLELFYYLLAASLLLYHLLFILRTGFVAGYELSGLLAFRIIKSFIRFVWPLIPYALLTTAYVYIGRYSLQNFASPAEQAYYGFGFQIVMVPVSIIFALSNVFLKRATVLYESNEFSTLQDYFLTSFFVLFTAFSIFFGVLIIHREAIIMHIVGADFLGSSNAIYWLSFYAIAHTLGVLNSNLFYISDRNNIYAISAGLITCVAILSVIASIIYTDLNAQIIAFIVATSYVVQVVVQFVINIRFFSFNALSFFLVALCGLSIAALMVKGVDKAVAILGN